jgi:hypothetical protein
MSLNLELCPVLTQFSDQEGKYAKITGVSIGKASPPTETVSLTEEEVSSSEVVVSTFVSDEVVESGVLFELLFSVVVVVVELADSSKRGTVFSFVHSENRKTKKKLKKITFFFK